LFKIINKGYDKQPKSTNGLPFSINLNELPMIYLDGYMRNSCYFDWTFN